MYGTDRPSARSVVGLLHPVHLVTHLGPHGSHSGKRGHVRRGGERAQKRADRRKRLIPRPGTQGVRTAEKYSTVTVREVGEQRISEHEISQRAREEYGSLFRHHVQALPPCRGDRGAHHGSGAVLAGGIAP